MALNRGKAFESAVKQDLKASFPGSFIYRIPDQMSFMRGSTNFSDFLVYTKGKLILLEAKTVVGNTFSLTTFTQYEKLLACNVYDGVLPYLIIWFQSHDKVVGIHISEVEKMVKDGCKSVNIKMLQENKYNILDLPSTKKRVFMETNYSKLLGD